MKLPEVVALFLWWLYMVSIVVFGTMLGELLARALWYKMLEWIVP